MAVSDTLMSKLLQTVVRMGASDLHIVVDRPPTIRLHGELRKLDLPALTGDDTNRLMKAIASERCQRELDEVGGSDFGFSFGDAARFRTAIFKQKGHVSIALRLLPNKLMTFEEIGLPGSIKDLVFKPKGLFLVTGPTGSGKTTTLASMINFINTEVDRHIVTIEDPIEYYFEHKKSIISQREVGIDVPSFEEAIRRALRQDPDVILVGEMRDLPTIQAAITAAETGHLVFATLHTTGAARTMNRIIDAFPVDQQEQIRVQLSVNIVAVVSQQLMPKTGGKGRKAAFEIMVMTPAIENLIRENKTYRVDSEIQTGRRHGMVLLDDCLFEMYQQGEITFEEMMKRCLRPQDLEKKLKEHALA